MINIGIIGYGKMGKIRHHVADNREDVQVISVYDPNINETEAVIAESPEQIRR